MTTPQQISSPPAALAEVQVNENNSALGQAFLWAHDVTADTGLTVGLAGGTFDGNTVADATLACTNNATNYIVAHRTTRVASVSTATTNWNDTTTYGRVARAVFASGVLTGWFDERRSVGGIFDHAAAAATGVSSVNGQTGAVVLDANDIGINDSDSLFAGATVEEALEQVGVLLSSAVTSVNGQSGAVTLDAGDIGIADSNSSFAGATVEEALEEIGATLAAQPMVVVPFYPGVPTASALMCLFAAPAGITTLTFAAAIAGSAGKALTAATAQTDFDVRKNATTSANGTSVGTIRFAAAGTVPTFIAASGFTLTGGSDWLTVWAPATPDATLANISASLYCTRS